MDLRHTRLFFLLALAGVVFATSLLGCRRRFDRAAMLNQLATTVIEPTYAAFAETARTLNERAEALQVDPSEAALNGLRAAWVDASMAWKHTEAFELGAVRSLRLNSRIDFWPTRPNTIEQALAADTTADGTSAFDAAYFQRVSVAAMGLPALEYLLFNGSDEPAVETRLLADDPSAARRRRYVAGLAAELVRNAEALVEAWAPTDTFQPERWVQEAGAGQEETSQGAINLLVNRMIVMLETLRDKRFGKPLGKDSGGRPQPEAAEAWRSGHSIQLAEHSLIGFRALYRGGPESAEPGEEAGLAAYVAFLNPALDETIRTRIEQALAAVRAVPPPLHAAVETRPEAVEAAYTALTDLLRLVKADVTSTLGVTLMFNDNDGD